MDRCWSMDYKISVIIPVYNAQDRLDATINSVVNQTIGFENIELILVDDKSKDKSRDIITTYSDKYDNIKPIFLKENSGTPAKPRNVGIDNATAQYLIFIDSDDEIIPDYCETLYNAIEKENADVAHCGYSIKFLDGIYTSFKEDHEIEDPTLLRLTMWGAIFSTELIRKYDIKCPQTLAQDVVFSIKAFTQANKITQLPNYRGYIYTAENYSSVTHKTSKNSFIKYLKGFALVNEYLDENNFNKEETWLALIPFMLYMFFKLDESKEEKIDLLKKYRELGLSINYPNIKLDLKPLDMVNKAIMKEQYNKAIFLSSIAGKMYNWRNLKNFIYKQNLNLKKVEIGELANS